MAKASSNRVIAFFARLIKVVMVAVVLPVAAGLLLGILQQLDRVSVGRMTARALIDRGFLTYVGLHLLLYRPVPLFRASHRMFSVLAIWLFGGQVSTVGDAGSGGERGGKERGKKGGGGEHQSAQGSTLVAFSPYVIPLYTVLVCALGWILTRWWDPAWVEQPISVLIGVTIAFHWIMTADELQQQRKRWHVETYLLALGLVFVLTLLVAAACLPWALPDFSFVQALSDGLASTQAILTAIIQHLFF